MDTFDLICRIRDLETSFYNKGNMIAYNRARILADRMCSEFWDE